MDKDYGIDAEVEIFESGWATSLTFKVQLKATETTGGKAPKRAIALDHLAYWARLDVPVLVVLYVADTQTTYAKWSTVHDPGLTTANQKTSTVTFQLEDELAARVQDLADEVRLLRTLRSDFLPRPLVVSVTFAGISASDAYKRLQEMRQFVAALELSSLIEVGADSHSSFLAAEVSHDLVNVSLPLKAGSLSLHDFGQGDPWDEQELQRILLTLLAAMLSARSQHSDAMRILDGVGICSVWYSPEFADKVVSTLIAEGRPEIGLFTAKYLLSQEESEDLLGLAALYMVPAQLSAETLSFELRDEVCEMIRQLSERFASANDPASAAAQRLNLANVHEVTGQHDEAMRELLNARNLQPELGASVDYLSTLAGVSFRAHMFRDSAEAYQALVNLGLQDSKLYSYLADALFASGNYKAALDVLDGRYGAPLTDRLSEINRLTCQEITAVLGLSEQEVRPLTDAEVSAVEHDPSLAERMLRAVDATNSGLWLQFDSNLVRWTAKRAVAMCRLNINFAPLWVIATIKAAHDTGLSPKQLDAVIETAVLDGGDQYLTMLGDALADAQDEHAAAIIEKAHAVALQNLTSRRGLAPVALVPNFDRQDPPGRGRRRTNT